MSEWEKQVITKADVGVLDVKDLMAPRVVQGVGAIAVSQDKSLGKRIEEAMQAAIKQGMADGVPLGHPEMKKRMLAARDRVKALT